MKPIALYIDPGTGAMFFSFLMGLISILLFGLRGLVIKVKFLIAGGKVSDESNDKLPLVIFAEGRRYWNVFKPVCDELERRKFTCEYWTTSEDDPAFLMEYEYVKAKYIGEGNKAFAKLNLMNAYMCLSTTPGLDVYQWKRSKDTKQYIHIFHNVAASSLYKMFGLDFYDVVLTTGDVEEEYIRRLEEVRNLPRKEVKVVGCTYLDDLLERIKKSEASNHKGVVVLLAPSWGKNSITNKYGEKFIDALIKTGYKIIFRPHPQSFTADKEIMDMLQKKYQNSDMFTWDRNSDNFPSLSEADILVSDFSGIVNDFAFCFNKPVMYANTNFDYSQYDAWWLDGDSWKTNGLACLGKEICDDDFGRLKEVIDELLTEKIHREKREAERDNAWKNVGHAAESIADYLIKKYVELSE